MSGITLSTQELERFVHELATQPERWRGFVRHDGESRVYARIWEDAQVNAWVICWSPNQDTGYHDHDHSAAAITVVEGSIREERLCLGGPAQVSTHHAGATFTVPATAIHRVLHAGGGPAVSIHAYSPPLARTGAYRLGPGGVLEREALGVEAELRAEPALA